jgi:long-chain fatty acid transport protein
MADANVALATRPSAQFINPANIVDIGVDGLDWEAGVAFGRVSPGFSRPAAAGFGAAAAGGFDGVTQYPVVPFAAFTFARSERRSWGFSVESPHGLETEWADGTFSVNLAPFGAPGTADLARKASLTVVRMGPAFAYAVSERWRLGARVFAQYVDALDQNDISTAKADGWSAGAQLGVRYRAEKLIFGAAYTSRTNTTIKGSLSNINAVASATLIPGSAQTQILLPDRLQIGAAFRLRPNLWWELDLDWIGWSYVDELTIVQSNGSIANAGTNRRNNRNTLSVRSGVQWQHTPRLTLRAGLAHDPTPVPDEDVSPITSLLEKTRLAFGGSYAFKGGLRLDLAYQFVKGEERTVAETRQDDLAGFDTGVYDGTYSSKTHIVALSLSGRC